MLYSISCMLLLIRKAKGKLGKQPKPGSSNFHLVSLLCL